MIYRMIYSIQSYSKVEVRVKHSLIPRPFPGFQHATQKSWKGPRDEHAAVVIWPAGQSMCRGIARISVRRVLS